MSQFSFPASLAAASFLLTAKISPVGDVPTYVTTRIGRGGGPQRPGGAEEAAPRLAEEAQGDRGAARKGGGGAEEGRRGRRGGEGRGGGAEGRGGGQTLLRARFRRLSSLKAWSHAPTIFSGR